MLDMVKAATDPDCVVVDWLEPLEPVDDEVEVPDDDEAEDEEEDEEEEDDELDVEEVVVVGAI
jgi:hypothetical protein